MAARTIRFEPDGEPLRLDAGPPVECAPDGVPFVAEGGRAELFLRTPSSQSFLGVVEPGDAVFPSATPDAVFVLVAEGGFSARPLGAEEADRAEANWRARFPDIDKSVARRVGGDRSESARCRRRRGRP